MSMCFREVALLVLFFSVIFINVSVFKTVRRDVQENDEEAVRVKEQSILELGTLLAKTGQAAGNVFNGLMFVIIVEVN